jgi:hypothetical protein
MPGLPGMELGNFIWIGARTVTATSGTGPFGGQPGAFQNETFRFVPAVGTGDRIDRHCVAPANAGGRDYRSSTPPGELLGGDCVPQPLADELGSLNQGVELVLSNVSLQQDQAAIGGDA